ncbi:MAG: DUF711 family protein, partial [Rhodothermales bacterium]|nr:DUF711 family protein [Rhodothermales bacterium]
MYSTKLSFLRCTRWKVERRNVRLPLSRYHAKEGQSLMLITRLEIESVTLGVSLRDCSSRLPSTACARIYDKIRRSAGHLVRSVEEAVAQYGGSVQKTGVAVSPIAALFDGMSVSDYVRIAEALDRAAADCGVTEIYGLTTQCSKSLSAGDEALLLAIHRSVASTNHVCASAECARAGRSINIRAIETLRDALKSTPDAVRQSGTFSRIAMLANSSGSSPYPPGAFHGLDEPDLSLKIGVNAIEALSRLGGQLDLTRSD